MVVCNNNNNPTTIDLKGLIHGPPASIESSNDERDPRIPYSTARLLVDCRCHLGECILWDDRENAVVFTSILDRKFHKLILHNDTSCEEVELKSYELPKMLCAFGLLEQEALPVFDNDDDGPSHEGLVPNKGYIVAWEDGFQLYDLERGKPLSPMSEGDTVNRSGLPDRLNDGRVDPTGRRFVCGGCAASPDHPLKVYRCEYDPIRHKLKHSVVHDTIQTTNSICWSLSGKEMYLADSPFRTIRKFDYNLEDGSLSNGRLMHTKRFGFPDGSVVDSQGYVWNATWREGEGTGMVDRIDPKTGEVVFTVYLPDNTSEASCCCFGGENLDILFITTAHEHLDPESEPHAGGLYAIKLPPGMKGCLEKRFRLDEKSCLRGAAVP